MLGIRLLVSETFTGFDRNGRKNLPVCLRVGISNAFSHLNDKKATSDLDMISENI